VIDKYGPEIAVTGLIVAAAFIAAFFVSAVIRRRKQRALSLNRLLATIGATPKIDAMERYRLFRRVLHDTDEGRKVLNEILTICHMYHPSHGNHDSHHTAFREGERNIALRILHTLNHEPKLSLTKTKDAK
jgi:hypothetical protein